MERRRLIAAITVVAAIPLAVVTTAGTPEPSREIWIPKKKPKPAAVAAPAAAATPAVAPAAPGSDGKVTAAGAPTETPPPKPAPPKALPETPKPTPGVVVGLTDAEPIADGKTILWTAAFQAAWDGLSERFATGDNGLDLADPAKPENVKAMNAGKLPPDLIDLGAAIQIVGTGSAKTWKSIEKASQKPRPEDAPPDTDKDLVAYARLEKIVRYPVAFARTAAPLAFGAKQTPVHAYGVLADAAEADPVERRRRAQIVVHVPPSIPEADVAKTAVLELKSTVGTRVIVSGRPAKATLADTWKDVASVLAGPGGAPAAGSRIAIPRVGVNVSRSYNEFVPASIPGENTMLLFARADTVFAADERSVVDAETPTKADDPGGAKVDLAIDGPFFVAVIADKAEKPYVLLWVGSEDALSK